MFGMSENFGSVLDYYGVGGSNQFTKLGNLLLAVVYFLHEQ